MTNLKKRKRFRFQLFPVKKHSDLLITKDGKVARPDWNNIDLNTCVPKIEYLKQYKNNGYKLIRYDKKVFHVHRLIGAAFHPNPQNKPFINHKNGIRDDNRMENIEWATQSDNELHKIYVLNKESQLRKRKVQIFKNGKRYQMARSLCEAARIINGYHSLISACCLGKRKTHKGYTFKYLK